MSDVSHDLALPGCTPEPLMAYLKALGILRLISEQKDSAARGWWKDDIFWLRSTLDRETLVKFFLEEYQPTPIMVPWSGGDFFGVNWESAQPKYSKTPTASRAIEAMLSTTTPRLAPYRSALVACKTALEQCNTRTQEEMGKKKWTFIQMLRSICDEPRVIDWIDAAAITGVEKFASLLGSGGGSDGNTHFSDNFIQNLWDTLPDFDAQRAARRGQVAQSVIEVSRRLLQETLFAIASHDRVVKRTSSLYDSGAVGGPNATQGMEREPLSNPWNIILALEGTVSFAGAAVKRLAANAGAEAVFPFQVSASVTTSDRLVDKERGGKEIWLPLWSRPAQSDEVLTLLREGRLECGGRPARTGVDITRAVAGLGVDRGITAFYRYAIVKGRVGGDRYNTAASLGRFVVTERADVDLLREIDPWLDRFRRAVETSAKTSDKIPHRFASALRAIDSAVMDFCKYGGTSFFQKIIIAMGRAERELALTPGKVGASKTKSLPLAGLSSGWMRAADDGSGELAIARALASVHDPENKIGPLRANLEPVDWKKRYPEWAEKDRAVVWNAADLATNLANILQRRMMDSTRAGCKHLPLDSRFTVPLDSVAAFLSGELDDGRIEELIWGLMLITDDGKTDVSQAQTDEMSVPRAYALLKLLFLPRPLVIERGAGGVLLARLLRDNEDGGVVIRPEPAILNLLRGGQTGEACAIAMRRLRASGLNPLPGPIRGRGVRDDDWREMDDMKDASIDPQRLAAALLIPIQNKAVNRLIRLVIRGEEIEDEQIQTSNTTNVKGGILS